MPPPYRPLSPVSWYKPTYRARRFPRPRIRLKRLPPPPKVLAKPIDNGTRTKKRVALTFDACSTLLHSRFDRKVAEILIRTKTPATLFFGGKWVMERPKDARWLASFPFFEIANHAYVHGHLTQRSPKQLRYELLWTQEIIYTVLGRIPTLFRPPFVEYNQRVVKAAAKLGLYTIIGDVSGGDPDPQFTKHILTRHILESVRNGSIVVLHINKGGKHTAKALPGIIRGLQRKGFELVTVGTLLRASGKLDNPAYFPRSGPKRLHPTVRRMLRLQRRRLQRRATRRNKPLPRKS